MVKETVITVEENAKLAEVLLADNGHFLVNFPLYSEEDGKKRISVIRFTRSSRREMNEYIPINGGKADFPFVNVGTETPVDVYVEIAKNGHKKITFTYEGF